MGVRFQALGGRPRFHRRPPTYADVHCIGYTKAIRMGRTLHRGELAESHLDARWPGRLRSAVWSLAASDMFRTRINEVPMSIPARCLGLQFLLEKKCRLVLERASKVNRYAVRARERRLEADMATRPIPTWWGMLKRCFFHLCADWSCLSQTIWTQRSRVSQNSALMGECPDGRLCHSSKAASRLARL